MAFMFSIKTVVQAQHVQYKEIWNAVMDGTKLPCKRDIGNAHDSFMLLAKFLNDYLAGEFIGFHQICPTTVLCYTVPAHKFGSFSTFNLLCW